MSLVVRQAEPADADAIFAFWTSLDEADRSFQCSPGHLHPRRDQLDEWLEPGSDKSIAVAEQDGVIVCTEIFIPSTAQSFWTNVIPEKFATVYPAVCRQASAWSGKGIWGWSGIAASAAMHVAIGWEEDPETGMLAWVGS